MDLISSYLSAFFKEYWLLVSTIGFIAAALALRQRFLQWIKPITSLVCNAWRLLNHLPTIPTETVRIIPDEHKARWHTVTWANGLPRTILSGTWHFTNIIDRPVFILAIYIRSPRKARSQGYLPRPNPISLPPDTPTSIDATFNFCPAIHKEGKAIKATVVFLDQYKNKYILKNTVFKPPSS
jgi:hypothetical protein